MGETTIHHLLFERDGKTTKFTVFDDIPTINPDGTLSRPSNSPLEATVLIEQKNAGISTNTSTNTQP